MPDAGPASGVLWELDLAATGSDDWLPDSSAARLHPPRTTQPDATTGRHERSGDLRVEGCSELAETGYRPGAACATWA
jgi:hypothetical protein